MTPRSCVFLWTLLLLCCALLRDTRALCADNCSTEAVLTATNTSITFDPQSNCNLSIGDKNSTDGSITGLTPGVLHEVQVHCFNCCKGVATKPDPVLNLDATFTTSLIFVNWTKPPKGQSSFYRIKWTHENKRQDVSTTETFKNISDLTAGTQYNITVTAVAEDNQTEGEGSTLSLYTKPNVVETVNVEEKTTNSVSLYWTKPKGNNSFYRVKWTNGLDNGNDNVTETRINVTKLTPGVRYNFTVRSVAGDNTTESEKREISSFTKPEAVLNLTVTEIRTNSVSLNWTKPEGNNSFYRVQWTDGLITQNDNVTETNINVPKLTPGVRYSFTVQSVAGDNTTESEVMKISLYTKPEKVLNLTFTEITTNSVSLNWTKPEGNNSFYRVQWTDGLITQNDSVTETNRKVPKLTPGVRYSFTVQSVAGDNTTESEVMKISLYTKPEKVLNLTVTEITTNSVSLNWTKPEGNNSFYRVQWTDGLNNRNDSVTETNITVTELTPGVRYNFTVQSVAGDNTTESEVMQIPLYTKPEAVLNLTVTEITTNSVSLNWTKPKGNNSFYRVQWTDGLNNRNDNVTETNRKVPKLTPGVRYSFTVQSVAGDNTTESEVMKISLYTKPEAVLNLTVTEITTNSVSLNWTKPEGNNSFYRVQWTDGLNNRNDNVTETNINATELTPGVRYNFTVQSVAGDNTTESEVMQIPLYTKPEAVLNLTVTEIRTNSVSLNWTKPEGNNSFYRVQWTDGLITQNDNVTETSINATELTPGVRYNFTVQSVAGDNTTESEKREISSFTKPDKVLNLTVTEIKTSSIFLNWTKPEGNNSFYRVQWTDGLITQNDNVTETSINATELTPGVRYNFTVQSVAGDNTTESEKREISSFTKPEAVLNLTVTEITTNSVSLNWTKPKGNNSFYRVQWTDGLNNRNDSVTETNKKVPKLTPGVRYSFTVQSVAGDNTAESEKREISSFTKPDKPENVTVTRRGTDSLSIAWDLSGGKSFFKVNISNDNLPYRNERQTANSSANFPGLRPGRIFNFTVTAVAGHLETVSDTFAFATIPTSPGPIKVHERTNSSIQLVWTVPENMGDAPDVRYNIIYQQQGGEMQNKATADNNTELYSLSSGTVYSISITTIGPQNLNSTPVNISSFTLPNPVLNLVARAESTTSIMVQWSDPPGVQPYYKYLVKVSRDTPAFVNSTTVSNTTSTRISELEPGTKYNITVKTVAATGINSTVVVTSSYTVPNAVTDLTVVHVNPTSVQLQWSRQNDHKPSYIYQVEAFQNGVLVHNDSTQTETYTFYGLNPGTLYTFQVLTVIEGVKSAKESIQNYTEPEVVSHVNVTGSTTNLSVCWELVSGQVSSYSVELSRAGNLEKSILNVTNKTTCAPFSGLKPGVDYCAVVVTKSGPHEIKSSQVCNATFPNPPGAITAQPQTVTSINFTWTLPEDMNPGQYNFSVTTVKGPLLTGNNWHLLNDLQSGSPYNISVVTVGARKYKSTEETAQNYTRPYSVTDLTGTGITTDTVTLEWNQPESKSHYSYLVQVSNKSTNNPRTVLSTNITITELQSGSNFSFIVTTRTADGTEADPVTVSYFTRPHRVQQLGAETLNTTAVRLSWDEPPQYRDYYLYWVEATGCNNQSKQLKEETVEISELNPGTNCTFCVSVEAGGIRGENICTSEYTKPEAVQPTVSGQSNDSIQVSWSKPEGNVEKYQVHLSRSSTDSNESTQLTHIELNGNSTGYLFENLSSGRLYSIVVVAHSGPFNATSESKENATFPNPPGPITILTKTTGSFHFRWMEAPLMEGAQFSYWLTLTQSPEGNSTDFWSNTTNKTIDSLPSGTSFIISVSTVGVLDFVSPKIYENVTTRPLSVQDLTTIARETHIQVDWRKPHDYKDSYRYNLTWEGPDFGTRVVVKDTSYKLDPLIPGSLYNISVTTETSDGTQAEPQWNANCTRASRVKSEKCSGPNEDDAQINLYWLKPDGQNSGFRVSVNDTEIQYTKTCCSHNISNLLHNTEYNISVETLSCGQASVPVTIRCTTGITNPVIPSDYQSKVQTVDKGHNKFSILIDPRLFNPVKGPITHVGVLVTRSLSDACSDCRKYLTKTYNEFKGGTAQAYLATVTKLQTSRSSQDLSVVIGNNDQWEGYYNGELEPQTSYRYSIVLFTSLTLDKHLVDGVNSLVSFTDFSFTIKLNVDPAVIGIAVGSTLGIFCILFIILIGFIIFWRRMSKKESPEIQIQSLRAKVSSPVRVEEYEAYFRKQKADSNCGFAEEFEDMKPVGTAQARIQALSVENKPKNRYTNVLPYDSSRVKLSIIRGSPTDDYINANYVPGYNSRKEFIAAQGPLPATVNDFWRMIWEKNVQTLVMLTRCNEQGRIKCEQYWSPGTKHFGNITVTTASEIPLEDWTIRDFTIKNVKTAETRSVRHFHFTAWPDHGVPETTELLISFRYLVREHMNQYSRHSPTVVHCSAGVGRTGTFIAIDHLIFQIERENIVDVYGVVHELRMHRPLMVQTEDQYVFLNQCALDIIRSRTGTNVDLINQNDLIYQNAAALSIYENLEPHRGFFKDRNHNT